MKDKIIISLTTIPSRINKIEPVIDSLCSQILKPYLIYINIPKKYNRFSECPEIPSFLKFNKKVRINYIDTDYGPATKFIGSLLNENINSNDIIVITDDDTIKERHWLSGLLIYYKYNNIIAYEEKNLGKEVVWGYLGFAFRKGIFDLKDMFSFYANVKDKCILVDDHWLTAYCHYKKIKIHTVSISKSEFINSGSISGSESLVKLKGSDSRWHISEYCRKHIKNKYDVDFPFWCCMGCCKRGKRKLLLENFTNKYSKTKKYSFLVLILIAIILMYCNIINRKQLVIITIVSCFLVFTLIYKNVENFDNDDEETIPTIPRVIIQTYFDKKRIPKKVYDNINKYAPGYKHIIWDDQECETFFKKYFNPNILLTFRKLKGAHKADLFRYCYLYKYGGIYLDIKTELIRPLNQVFPNNYTYSVLSIIKNSIYQGIIATPPGNPLFLKLIYFMVKLVEKRKKFPYIIFTIDFFHKIYDYCDQKPKPGLNIGKKGYNYYLYIEKCSKNKNKCHDGLDRYGLCCYVYNGHKRMIKNRYSDFPW
jgi:hypothetical protein